MKRIAEDVLAELLRRHRHGEIRPLWVDLPESGQVKATWISEARRFIDQMNKLGWKMEEKAEA